MVVNQAMIAGYFVTGTVASAATGAGLAGIGVGFHVTTSTPSAATTVASGLTGVDGTYRLLVPRGSWRVGFFPNGSGSPYVGLWWHDHRDGTGYDLVDVHSDLTGISEALPSI